MYYVYELIDPRCGNVFYVGKGIRKRIDAHELEARAGRQSRKCDRIREIEACGLSVVKRKVELFLDEKDAYNFEAARIREIGLENLTNMTPGGGSPRRYTFSDREIVEICVKLLKKLINMRLNILRDVCGDHIYRVIARRGVEWVNEVASSQRVKFKVNEQ